MGLVREGHDRRQEGGRIRRRRGRRTRLCVGVNTSLKKAAVEPLADASPMRDELHWTEILRTEMSIRKKWKVGTVSNSPQRPEIKPP